MRRPAQRIRSAFIELQPGGPEPLPAARLRKKRGAAGNRSLTRPRRRLFQHLHDWCGQVAEGVGEFEIRYASEDFECPP